MAKPWQGIDPIRSAERVLLRRLASGDPPVGIIFDGAQPHEKWCPGAAAPARPVLRDTGASLHIGIELPTREFSIRVIGF